MARPRKVGTANGMLMFVYDDAVDNWVAWDGAITSVTSLNAEKNEDAAHSSGATGMFVLGVRNDVAASLTSADGDYSPLATDSAGRLGIADLGGTISIDDGGGSITVDGSLSATFNAEKVEDAAHSTGATGDFILAVRNDSFSTSFTSTDGDYSPVGVDSAGRLGINLIIPGTGATNLGKAEDAAHVSGDTGVFALAVNNDSGDGTPAVSSFVSAAGDYSPIAVDNAGRVAVTFLGATPTVSVLNNFEKTEDAPHSTGQVGAFMLGVRNSSFPQTTFTSADLDYSPIAVNGAGAVYIAEGYNEDVGHNSGDRGAFVLAVRNDTRSTTFTSGNSDYSPLATDSTGSQWVLAVGNVAHDAVDADNPIKIGGKAETTLPTAVADADRVDAFFDEFGRLATLSTEALSPSDQASTDAYATVSGSTIDTFRTGAKFISFLLAEVGGANGITFKLQGSIDGTTYTNIVGPLDATGAEDADGEVALAASASQEWFITPEFDSGAKAAYRYYRAQVKSTSAGNAGSARVRVFAK